MKHPIIVIRLLALLACTGWASAALAQQGTGGGGLTSGPGAPQPRPQTPDFAPPAVPGAGGALTISTSLPVPKVESGNPTTQLFTAVNADDYNSAQDAVGRGADMNAQNVLGETPLDLSIALNRNSITFMLLSARNESGDTGQVGAPWSLAAEPTGGISPSRKKSRFHAIPARVNAPPRPLGIAPTTAGNNPGTPNPSAGFLGFGQH